MGSAKRQYLIVECSNCKRFLLATSDKKTRRCPYCGKRTTLEHAKITAHSKDAEEARTILQELRTQEAKSTLRDSGQLQGN